MNEKKTIKFGLGALILACSIFGCNKERIDVRTREYQGVSQGYNVRIEERILYRNSIEIEDFWKFNSTGRPMYTRDAMYPSSYKLTCVMSPGTDYSVNYPEQIGRTLIGRSNDWDAGFTDVYKMMGGFDGPGERIMARRMLEQAVVDVGNKNHEIKFHKPRVMEPEESDRLEKLYRYREQKAFEAIRSSDYDTTYSN